jgi:hypothetical protein
MAPVVIDTGAILGINDYNSKGSEYPPLHRHYLS